MSNLPSLDALGLKHATDKSSAQHDYLRLYETFFAPLRDEPLTLLEIGVLNGASLKMWEEYFPQATVIGADIVPAAKRFEHGRVTVEIMDQSNLEDLVRVGMTRGPFDIIIEDGSHVWEHQITSLRTLFPFLKSAGIYVAEDLQTNYGAWSGQYRGSASISCVEYLKKWLDLRVGDEMLAGDELEDPFLRTYGRAVEFMMFHRHACLIKKQAGALRRDGIGGGLLVAGVGTGIPVRILAHLSNVGDVTGADGYVNPGADPLTLQGLAIDAHEGVLEYRVRSGNRNWGSWVSSDRFAGTRGLSELLTGVTVRLRQDAVGHYTLRTFGRFAGHPDVVEADDGEDCTAPNDQPLCGIQIRLASIGTG